MCEARPRVAGYAIDRLFERPECSASTCNRRGVSSNASGADRRRVLVAAAAAPPDRDPLARKPLLPSASSIGFPSRQSRARKAQFSNHGSKRVRQDRHDVGSAAVGRARAVGAKLRMSKRLRAVGFG